MISTPAEITTAAPASIVHVGTSENTKYPTPSASSIEVYSNGAMLQDEQIKVHERHIMPEELEGFEQCWLTGTAAEVTPVGQIGDYMFEVGAMTRDVAESYEKVVRA